MSSRSVLGAVPSLTVLVAAIGCGIAVACSESDSPALPTAPMFDMGAYCTLTPEQCQEIQQAIQDMNNSGYCGTLQQQALNTFNSTQFGYHPGSQSLCDYDPNTQQGTLAYVYFVYSPTDEGGEEVTEVSGVVYICDDAFGLQVGESLAHEAYHQVEMSDDHAAGSAWGQTCYP